MCFAHAQLNAWPRSSGAVAPPMSYDDYVDASDMGDSQHEAPRTHRPRARSHGAAGAYAGGDAGGAGVLPGFVANDGQGGCMNGKPCRAPLDAAPFSDEDESDEEDISFPSIFLPDTAADSLGREQVQHAWTRLQHLIANALDTNTVPKDLVAMVYNFYEQQIRTEYADAPRWSKRSIYKYVYSVGERQADQGIAAVYSAIELLRNTVASKNLDSGEIQANGENVKLLLSAVKTHASLIDLRKKRLAK